MKHRNDVCYGAAVFCFLLGLLLVVMVLTQGCASGRMIPPPIDIQTWSGDSIQNGISRSQDQKTLQCRDPVFDQYVCLTYEDFQKIHLTLYLCKDW